LTGITRAIEWVESVGSCGEQPNLGAEGLALLGVERREQMSLRRSEAVIKGREELSATLGGDDSPSSPVGRIGATLDQVRRFEVIEEVGHDRPVDPEVLGQGELATNCALSGGGKHLVAPGAARKVGHRVACGGRIRPKDNAQAPSEVACQRADAAGGAPNFVYVTRDVIHHPIIADDALLPRSSAMLMICVAY
jgi:hypothetical protein